MNRLRPNLPISALFLLMIVSCSPLRKIGKNESLLVKKKVIQEGPHQVRDDIKAPASDLQLDQHRKNVPKKGLPGQYAGSQKFGPAGRR